MSDADQRRPRDDDLPPRHPDMDAVPEDLQLLAGLNNGVVTLLTEDGVGPAVLVLVPPMFAHARRLREE